MKNHSECMRRLSQPNRSLGNKHTHTEKKQLPYKMLVKSLSCSAIVCVCVWCQYCSRYTECKERERERDGETEREDLLRQLKVYRSTRVQNCPRLFFLGLYLYASPPLPPPPPPPPPPPTTTTTAITMTITYSSPTYSLPATQSRCDT